MVSAEDLKIGILAGPTASGKSSLAVELAQARGDIEIINADSVLIYKELNIGAAKPSEQELKQVPHHLINIRQLTEPFTAGDFYRMAQEKINEIHSRSKRVLFVGGTGFYIKALQFGLWQPSPADPAIRARLDKRDNPSLYQELYQLDQETALRIGGNDRYRLIRSLEVIEVTGKTPSELEQVERPADPRFQLWVIDRDKDDLLDRINQRTQTMLDDGLIDEVKHLRENFPGTRALGSVGYLQVCDHLDGKIPSGRKLRPGLDGLYDEIVLATKQLVKKQRTWFKGQKVAKHYLLDQEKDQLVNDFNDLYS